MNCWQRASMTQPRPESVVGAWVLLEEIVLFTRGLLAHLASRTVPLGARDIGSPVSGHAIRASGVAAACPSSLAIRTRL